MNILFFGKKREGKGVHEYQRHIIRNMPVKNQEECYARKLMMDNQTYVFDRFDDMGNAVFVDDQWDEEEEYKPQPYGSFADLKESFYIPKWAEKLYGTPV